MNPRTAVRSAVVLASVIWVAALTSAPGVSLAAEGAAAKSPVDLALYRRLLESHTRPVGGLVEVAVDYQGLAEDPDWNRLVRQVESARPSGFDRNERLAYWINAYNILTIDLVLKHYPVESIKNIGSFFSPVWNVEVATIEGRAVSLGEIEHEILRPIGEPRIHAAIVCASLSCPPLARTPFQADRLDADLAAAMRTWLANPKKGVRIDRASNQITISKIFDWFEEDFEASGGVLAVIAPALSPEDARWIEQNGADAALRTFPYDWSLNDIPR
jgi:hypothetical protein